MCQLIAGFCAGAVGFITCFDALLPPPICLFGVSLVKLEITCIGSSDH